VWVPIMWFGNGEPARVAMASRARGLV
jgi:hypothetical protein